LTASSNSASRASETPSTSWQQLNISAGKRRSKVNIIGISGNIQYTSTALDPIHHGGGTVGNTQMLRVQEIITDKGSYARVPFVSGNSIKHLIRDGAARFALEAMTAEPGSLTKQIVDLLLSGGSLSKKGSAVSLQQARQISELLPMLSLCGYSAANFMTRSKIAVSNLNLVCSENLFRLPAPLKSDDLGRAATFRCEEFGTRHDVVKQPNVRKLLDKASRNAIEDEKSKSTSQMYYEYETIIPGAQFWGSITLEELLDFEMAALRTGIERAALSNDENGIVLPIGAKSSIGLGRMRFDFGAPMRSVFSTPTYSGNQAIMPADDDADKDVVAGYVEHLRSRREEILDCLMGVTK